MAHRPQGLSRTLPKSFTFSSGNASRPKTPEHPFSELEIPPPPPRHSSYRVRRPRFDGRTNLFTRADGEPSIFDISRADIPLPSIEFPPSVPESDPELPPNAPVASEFLQVPAVRRMAFKTPPAQIRTTPYTFPETTPWSSDKAQEFGDCIERPASACSTASDSSISSVETFTTQPSLGGSCTSPESEIYDPFGFHPSDSRKLLLESPSLLSTRRTQSLEVPRKKSRWTAEMDNHLWNTYQIYLQDPTITPFKMLPGSLPPLGVSHRVAREAKKSWMRVKSKAQQPASAPHSKDGDSAVVTRGDEPALDNRSGSNTPTATKAKSTKPHWPRSEAATRRRLKFLCKTKLSIAPHYQRLLQSRSPSPFLDTFSMMTRGPSRRSNSTAFATRDLGVSLVSSSLPSTMSQITEASHPTEEDPLPNWFNNPELQQPPSMSTSATPAHALAYDPIPRLGSPFMYNTWGPNNSHLHAPSTPPAVRRDTIHVTGSRLRSPARMDVNTNVHKRRAQNPLEVSPNSGGIQRNIRDLFRDGKLRDGQRRVRLRNRGNTTTGEYSSKERIEQLFSPQSPLNAPGDSVNESNRLKVIHDDLLHSDVDSIRRLGSPFKLDRGPISDHPRSPRHGPSMSDPSNCGTAQGSSTKAHDGPATLPYDATEEGISDAERIRRQILNLPFTRK